MTVTLPPGMDGTPAPLWDTGNTLLEIGEPGQLTIGKMPIPDGEIGIVTIRTRTTTLTLSLNKAIASDWVETLIELRDALSGSSLIIPGRGQAAVIASAAVSRQGRNGRPG